MSWNFGDLFDAVARAVPPSNPALIHGERLVTWGELDRRTNNLARRLVARGAKPDDKVAFYLRNRPEYIEGVVAATKARLVHVNVNYRYVDDELLYVLDNSDARVLIFSGEFEPHLAAVRDRLPKLEFLLQIEDGHAKASYSEAYESWAGNGDGEPLSVERSPDDLLFMYTGGTTGLPKGVMWRADDLWTILGCGAGFESAAPPATLEELCERIRAAGGGKRMLPVCPIMHGTGLLGVLDAIGTGGSAVTLTGASFDPEELWDAVDRHCVNALTIVGDVFARPMLRALDENPGRWNLSSLNLILSSGVIWSQEVKQGLLRHNAGMMLIDTLGSSEAAGLGVSVSRAGSAPGTARFRIGRHVKVFAEDDREVERGSGEPGFLGVSGPMPLGYYKDQEKTRKTFKVIDGVRYSIPGDWCRVEADGTLTFLGRGSACINTGGEKVYPEEVEEALKTHPSVHDALVVGLPDDRWGQAVIGVVELDSDGKVDEEALREHVRTKLAGYKVPKRMVFVDSIGRPPHGKPDYAAATRLAEELLGRPG